MEACASAHHWGRRFKAVAIHEAALRPTMRFVPVKTTEQQDLQMLHRTRDRLITQRTGLINHIRGLLDERCKRLATLPGVGLVIATALIAAVDDGRHFSSGRALAAWIKLVPRQYTTGGKPRLGGIGKRGNQYLRRQLIHGARSVLIRIAGRSDRRAKWAQDLIARAGHNKSLVAIANKTARMAWSILRSGESYKEA